ncbi:MAG: lysophospholipid acyltransferase family protein, partial [Aristaeellaceae bacterium]
MSEQKENKSLTESKPRQLIRRPATESAAGYRALRVLATTMFHTLLPVRYRHLERAQLDAPFIVIGNHLSILDPIIVAAAIKRYEVAFMGKNELSSNGLFKRFLLSIHVIFVNRHNSDMEAMRTSMRALRSGEVLGIFP